MKNLQVLAICLLLLPSVKSHAGLININVVDRSGLSSTQEALFDEAVKFWESTLIGTQENINVDMQIEATAPAIDGRGGILGQAGPRGGTFYDGGIYITRGIMEFDAADLDVLETRGTLFDVILHEMAHVIGFGTVWGIFDNLYVQNSGEYLGRYALAMYREEFDANAAFVPVDIVSGVGTKNSHWDENWAGGRSDLMTGFLEGTTDVSNTTLAAFADIGYIVKLKDGRIIGVSAPATLSLFLVFGAFLLRLKKS
jgi:hypothetical protein